VRHYIEAPFDIPTQFLTETHTRLLFTEPLAALADAIENFIGGDPSEGLSANATDGIDLAHLPPFGVAGSPPFLSDGDW